MKALGIILAGGRATRMGGGDKCLLPLHGAPMLTHIVLRFRPQVAGLALNANGDPSRFAASGLPVLPDSMEDHPGPLAGVLAGMDHAAAEGYSHIVTVAGDTPFFPRDLVTRLTEAASREDTPLAMATTPAEDRPFHRHPTFGLWPVALRENLRSALAGGTRKIVAWTDPLGCARASFPERPDPFFNINTPEDLEVAERMT
ncbi:molybdenum cofactor guanylyltransferase MobA [Algicella marina]|uniref:Molybdenum cofactor guanylyltransferase n=1 Tax=Algicella marina TaxID=2683284 RepID=A0A6P1T2Q6_9RHOB|nr:molybdenum cofactor guanylyltransferase MobA [Algicella marina]QHQ36998.1 molybdenum cofactor guanylyltransferase MobA [Algicella marina]